MKIVGSVNVRGLAHIRDANQESVDTALVTVGLWNCPVEDAHMGFEHVN